ncbi:MAG TPA: DUF2269 domain-containing protein [Xanthobacteraceae bacterium]|nr:DUF2269 domain-containing protein [Xanthobacteraceae bacterium]
MIDIIFAIKFVHVLAATLMFGTWWCLALFMLLAHRSGNTSVVALVSQFVVTIEKAVMIPAILLQPLSGFPLASAIGLQPLNELWIQISLVFFAAIIACWLLAFRAEIRIRGLAREAALESAPLPKTYRRLFRTWSMLAMLLLIAMMCVIALMIWQPRLD